MEDFKLQNPKIYFQTKKQALWAAKNLNCWLSLEERNQRFYINIFSNNYLKKGERERKEAMEENRAYNVKRLKEKLAQIFFERDDMNTTLMSMISEEMRRDCRLCSPQSNAPSAAASSRRGTGSSAGTTSATNV